MGQQVILTDPEFGSVHRVSRVLAMSRWVSLGYSISPTSQKHAGRWIGYSKLYVKKSVNVSVHSGLRGTGVPLKACPTITLTRKIQLLKEKDQQTPCKYCNEVLPVLPGLNFLSILLCVLDA